MIERFEGEEGRRRLISCLKEQRLVAGNESIAASIAERAELRGLGASDLLIRQGDTDNRVYFIVSGKLRILVNDRDVALRAAGEHIGEMAVIDASLSRTATAIAAEPTVVVGVAEPDFLKIAEAHPGLWRMLAIELARRLHQRARFHVQPNKKPILFIGSSRESLQLAGAIAEAIPIDVAAVTLWTKGVFGASSFAIEDLAAQVETADFAALVAAPDDRVTSRGKESDAPRDNVIFELGLFMGSLGRKRTFLIVPKGVDLKIPSDLLGLNPLSYDAALKPADAGRALAQSLADIIASSTPK